MDKYFLYGPAGSGKSSAGALLADSLDLPFVDLDLELEALAGAPIPEIFATQGEEGFRKIETAALQKAVRLPGEAVIALGGGALLDPKNRATADKHGRILCLRAGIETILARTASDDTIRPLLAEDPEQRVRAYLAQRDPHYNAFPLQLNTDTLTPPGTAWEAQLAFGAFRLRAMGAPYDVRVRRQSLAEAGDMLQIRGLNGPVCIVADENTEVHALTVLESLRSAGYAASLITIPAGEAHKTVRTVEELWNGFLEHGLERGSTIVAVGGGVVTDLAGFAAAAYLRGVSWAAVPTSLLGMVDAAIGGKTGADLPQGKNLVGAFHPPRLVLADPDVLATLPERELRAGQAEMIKAGVIGSPELFQSFLKTDDLEEPGKWIPVSIGVKVALIEADPFEAGPRGHLNFGHTIGHGVEHASGYELLHGEAIAIGMALETRLAEDLGYAQIGTAAAVRQALHNASLPTEIPANLPKTDILSAMQLDKKKQSGSLRFALPRSIGEFGLFEIEPEAYRRLMIA